MFFHKKFTFISVFISIFLFFATVYGAGIAIDPLLRPDSSPTPSGREYMNIPSHGTSATDYRESLFRLFFFGRITNVLLGIAGTIAIFFIISNAWYLIASAGREETITQHKKGLMWAVIGLILVILSYSIIRFIISIPFQADEGTKSEQPAKSK